MPLIHPTSKVMTGQIEDGSGGSLSNREQEVQKDKLKLRVCGTALMLHSSVVLATDLLTKQRECNSTFGISVAILTFSSLQCFLSYLLGWTTRLFSNGFLVLVSLISYSITGIAAIIFLLLEFIYRLPGTEFQQQCNMALVIAVGVVVLVGWPTTILAIVILATWLRDAHNLD